MRQSVGGKDMNAETGGFTVLTAVTKHRPVKRLRNLVRATVNRIVCELVKRLYLPAVPVDESSKSDYQS